MKHVRETSPTCRWCARRCQPRCRGGRSGDGEGPQQRYLDAAHSMTDLEDALAVEASRRPGHRRGDRGVHLPSGPRRRAAAGAPGPRRRRSSCSRSPPSSPPPCSQARRTSAARARHGGGRRRRAGHTRRTRRTTSTRSATTTRPRRGPPPWSTDPARLAHRDLQRRHARRARTASACTSTRRRGRGARSASTPPPPAGRPRSTPPTTGRPREPRRGRGSRWLASTSSSASVQLTTRRRVPLLPGLDHRPAAGRGSKVEIAELAPQLR